MPITETGRTIHNANTNVQVRLGDHVTSGAMDYDRWDFYFAGVSLHTPSNLPHYLFHDRARNETCAQTNIEQRRL